MTHSAVHTDYTSFLNTITGARWKEIGLERRAGVAVPLFSLYSETSIGVGELTDLVLLAKWCKKTGMSIIQLLPMNDAGFDFRPYDAQSTVALEPMHLNLRSLKGIGKASWVSEVDSLASKFPAGGRRVPFAVKKAKLVLLHRMFENGKKRIPPAFKVFCEEQSFWLRDYALFKVIKDLENQKCWKDWPEPFRIRESQALEKVIRENTDRFLFYQWLQWQLCEQFREVHERVRAEGVFLMGDIPFLVSLDSADVWARQDYFKLGLSSGAPPDLYFANGQRWGMPAYNWEAIARDDYAYLKSKLRFAAAFYDLFRIDHVVGVFRLWTISVDEPPESAGFNGIFDPADENVWEEHGRRLLSIMIESAGMLPCAEDLGTVPDCSNRVLEEFAIPGMEVQRWRRNWDGDGTYLEGEVYRKNALAVISTHDMTDFSGWWKYEIGTVDENLFRRKCQAHHIDFDAVKDRLFDLKASRGGRLLWKSEIHDAGVLAGVLERSPDDIKDLLEEHRITFPERRLFLQFLGLDPQHSVRLPLDQILEKAIRKANAAASIFSIQMIHDWLALGGLLKGDPLEWRVNLPGTMSDANWSIVLPLSLEAMLKLEINKRIRKINMEGGRALAF